MNKVILPKEVAEAIKHCRVEEFSNRVILRMALDERGNSALRDLLYKFAEEKFDALVSALYNDYEVEQTPEEKLRVAFEYVLERIKCLGEDHSSADHFKGTKSGIIIALETLNIKIDGINT